MAATSLVLALIHLATIVAAQRDDHRRDVTSLVLMAVTSIVLALIILATIVAACWHSSKLVTRMGIRVKLPSQNIARSLL
ncbi:jg12382 [Pararge aegeria aegeria]|uniref:Jg12382 protein n=1 Tax=Pararge aegeria aegeria TaxID=348720 RepID=A0A8S4SC64_9NEOP|nr:jg12382 [Pararge aegeria aegeria]